MPSDQSTWLVSVPQDGDTEGLFQELAPKLTSQARLQLRDLAQLPIPSFKTGTLDGLIGLSEDLPKFDTIFTATVAKAVDTLRNLLNNEPAKLAQHILIDERPVDSYLLSGWRWNEGRYPIQRSLRELVDSLNNEMTSIDNTLKSKVTNYNLVKGSLVQMQRRKTGNLSVRSLADLVSASDVVKESEYLETVFVAVPKPLVKEWNNSYERLTSMVVPRSAKELTADDEFALYSVVIFKRIHDDFIQKCRERKFIVRDFVFSEEELQKEREALETANTTERELWTELLRISRATFSEAFQILVHLKVLRLFVESVLRYGLPSHYIGMAIKPDPKTAKKVFGVLQTQFAYLSPRSNPVQKRANKKNTTTEDFVGEYQNVLDQEYFDFVMYEVPWIIY
ncbi:ATPase, V1 complex, subunit C [Coprinopsis marcescibilis]|uniref:V-type proton ATPase subunit C n=1 Tax=Coprinopsis marcescibilis TaxID=230819 RepID=A0A5C3KSE4_COPMA|nr:ATPase, V1 complex, subunit C [Coprinopsis marcescibilis]